MHYLILEKGKGALVKEALESFKGQVQLRTIYKVWGRYIFFYTSRLETP